MRTIKQIVCLSLLLTGTGANAASAPVTDLSSSTPDQRLSTLERLIQQSNQRQLEVQQQLDALLDEVNNLRGDTELHGHKLEQLVERQRELYQELENRFSRMNDNQIQPGSDASSSGTPTATSPPPEPEVVYVEDIKENEAYDRAMKLVLQERRYDDAIPEFRAFIKKFPDSGYAPNAYYWLGQLLFNKGSYAQAKIPFERVMNFYPDSNKRSDAIYKLGAIAMKTNRIEEAKAYFNRVISEYPDSTEAKLATSRLQSLDK